MSKRYLILILLLLDPLYALAATTHDKPPADAAIIAAESILRDHGTITKPSTKSFQGPVLAYVTPWNSKGYDIAKQLPGKFTFVSPCWFEILPSSDGVKLNGEHDVDKGWIKEIRSNAKKQNVSTPFIVPRFLLEPGKNVYRAQNLEDISRLVLKVVQKFNFDGAVLDTGYNDQRKDNEEKTEFLKSLSVQLHDLRKKLIVVVPPHGSGLWSPGDIHALIHHLDGFSIMTYDFSMSSKGPGPNSPLNWFSSNIMSYLPPAYRTDTKKSQKLLFGANLYGYDFGEHGSRDAVLGNRVIELLQKHNSKLVWQKDSHEHYFKYKDERDETHTVFYPTVQSIRERLELAVEMNVGISLWEIGQGLNYFYDLF